MAAATIHLQSIGKVPAKPAGDLQVGDKLMWNFGYTSVVKSITRNKSGKTLTAIVVENGKEYTRRFNVTRLVAVVK